MRAHADLTETEADALYKLDRFRNPGQMTRWHGWWLVAASMVPAACLDYVAPDRAALDGVTAADSGTGGASSSGEPTPSSSSSSSGGAASSSGLTSSSGGSSSSGSGPVDAGPDATSPSCAAPLAFPALAGFGSLTTSGTISIASNSVTMAIEGQQSIEYSRSRPVTRPECPLRLALDYGALSTAGAAQLMWIDLHASDGSYGSVVMRVKDGAAELRSTACDTSDCGPTASLPFDLPNAGTVTLDVSLDGSRETRVSHGGAPLAGLLNVPTSPVEEVVVHVGLRPGDSVLTFSGASIQYSNVSLALE